MEERKRVAVVGTGLAGLVVGYLLHTLDFRTEDDSELRFDVELFEKSGKLGMDNSSISVDTPGGSFRIDSPMRSINGGSHSRVFQLYRHLDIALRRSDFSYSFSRLERSMPSLPCPPSPPPPYAPSAPSENDTLKPPSRPPQRTEFIYEGSSGLVFPPLALPADLASASLQRRMRYSLHLLFLTLSYLHLLLLAFFYVHAGLTRHPSRREQGTMRTRGAARAQSFTKRIAQWLQLCSVSNESVEAWCDRHWIWSPMREEVLVPLYAAVSTVGRNEARNMPIAECLEYIVSTFGSSHWVADTGVQQVVRRLAAPFPLDSVHLSSEITDLTTSISREGSPQIKLTTTSSGEGRSTRHMPFDYLIFATQANQAAALIDMLDPTPSTAEVITALRAFTYVRTLVVNHTDASLLPINEVDRRDLNLASFESPRTQLEAKLDREDDSVGATDWTLPISSVQATHIIERTHPRLQAGHPLKADEPTLLLQTTNPLVPIDPSRVLSSAWYERAAVSSSSKAVLGRFLLGRDGDNGGGDGDLQGRDGIYFSGSWCAEGIPLLEGCVQSALEVVKAVVEREDGRMPAELPF